jgi:hypothetical protein
MSHGAAPRCRVHSFRCSYPRRDSGTHRGLLQDGHDKPAHAERQVLERRNAVRGRSRAQSSTRWAVRLRSGSASSARTRDEAERDVDDPALHGHVCTALVPLEHLREGRPQGAQLLALFGLDGLDLRGVAEALEQLAGARVPSPGPVEPTLRASRRGSSTNHPPTTPGSGRRSRGGSASRAGSLDAAGKDRGPSRPSLRPRPLPRRSGRPSSSCSSGSPR